MISRNSKFAEILLTIFLIVLSTAPAFALGENNRNLLLIGLMPISPVIVIYYQQFRKEDFLLLLFLLVIVICPSLFHSASMRWSTVLYTAMFCVTFMGVTLLVRNSGFKIVNYIRIIKYLIYAFAALLLIQQFCVLMNWSILSVSNYVPETPWKLNSLSAEPAHTSRIIGVLMYCYILMREKFTGVTYPISDCIKEDKWVWLSFFWIIFTSMSGTAFIFLFIIALKFIRLRNLVIILATVILGFITLKNLQLESFERFMKVVSAAMTFEEQNITAADHSASFRIVPMIRYVKMIDIGSLDTWFGHGVDYIQDQFSSMFAGVNKGAMAHGGLMILLMDYGLISFLIFILFTLRFSIRKSEVQTYLLWFVMVLSVSINVQLLWFTLVFFWINDYFLKAHSNGTEGEVISKNN